MTDFDEARVRYAAARTTKESARSELAQAVEHVRRLERAHAERERTEDQPGGDGGDDALTAARLEEFARRSDFVNAKAVALGAGLDFTALIDPADAVRLLPDDVPIALFPLRLETRFATVGAGPTAQRYVYVRVYPDDVLVDTFQDRIAQAEFDKVVLYWTQRWRAGGHVAGHRAAWAGLVLSLIHI